MWQNVTKMIDTVGTWGKIIVTKNVVTKTTIVTKIIESVGTWGTGSTE